MVAGSVGGEQDATLQHEVLPLFGLGQTVEERLQRKVDATSRPRPRALSLLRADRPHHAELAPRLLLADRHTVIERQQGTVRRVCAREQRPSGPDRVPGEAVLRRAGGRVLGRAGGGRQTIGELHGEDGPSLQRFIR